MNKAGLELTKKWEGCKLEAYLCPAGVWTIGYGTTTGAVPGVTVKKGMKITKQKAEDLLSTGMKRYEQAVRDSVKVNMTSNQSAALSVFTYNIGVAGFKGSSALREINKSNYDIVPIKMALWNKARVNGELVVLKGLVNRRADEANLFMTPDAQVEEIPVPMGTKAEIIQGKPIVKSTTIQTTLLTNAPAVIAAMNGLDWKIALPLIVFSAILTTYLIYERVKKSRMDGV